jgi:hypothetical protein
MVSGNLVDHADDYGTDRGLGDRRHLTGRVALVENEDRLSGAGVDAVDGDRLFTRRPQILAQQVAEQQSMAGVGG